MKNTTVNNISQTNKSYIFLVFLFSPIVALIIAIKQYKQIWAKNIVWMFSAFYGYSFVIGNSGSDINRYKARFEIHGNMKIGLTEYLNQLFDEGKNDFLQPMISYIVSAFTSDFRIYLLVIGAVFGYFLSRNIWSVLILGKNNPHWYGLLFILVFSFIYAFWDINVMRFTLAAHTFVYGVFKWIFDKNKGGLLFTILAVFFHFSFSIPVALFLIYLLLGNKFVKFYYIFFLMSFFFSELNIASLKNQTAFLPKNYIEKSDEYLNEEYKTKREELNESKNFRGKYYQLSLKWATGILLTFIFFHKKRVEKNREMYSLLSVALLFLGVFNLLSVIPSMNRFQFLSYLFAFALFYGFFNFFKSKYALMIIYLTTPLILFYFIMKLRIGMEFTGIFTLLGGPITAFLSDNDVSLIEFFK